MIWQLAVITAVLWLVYVRWQKRRIHKIYKEIPAGAFQQLPIIGHAHYLGGNQEDAMSLLQRAGRIATAQGGLSTFWFVNKLYLNVTDPVSAEIVMKSCMEKDIVTMNVMRTFFGNGSLFATASIWRPRRKILAPLFSMKNLNYFLEIFDKQSNIMVNQLKKVPVQDNFSIWKYLTTYTFDSVCETTMGVEIGSQLNLEHPFLKSFDMICKMLSKRMNTPWLYPNFIYKSLPMYKEFLEHRRVLYDFITELIRNKKVELASNNNEEKNENTRRAFLEMMIIESGGETGYTELELCEEVIVLLIAGTDTSAVGAAYVTVMLSRHQDIQAKVYQELQQVFGDSDQPVIAKDLLNLTYLEAVIKETLRMYPPVPVVMREVNEDVTLPNGTILVEGVSVLLNLWGTHRNYHYWGDDVEVFRPERFLEGPLKHPVQFTPFSHTPRNCLGYNYAMMSMKTVISNLLRQYRILPYKGLEPAQYNEPMRVKFEIMMKPVEDFIVRLEPRKM